MLFQLLADETETTSSSGWATYVMLGVIVVALIVMIVVNSRRSKKRQQEQEDIINAVGPGNKVKTIGGICGIVVEVDDAENTFVLETGTEASGKCFIKFDKQAIYQTDAVATPAKEENAEPAAPETTEEEVQANADEVFAEPAAETASEDKTSEEEDK